MRGDGPTDACTVLIGRTTLFLLLRRAGTQKENKFFRCVLLPVRGILRASGLRTSSHKARTDPSQTGHAFSPRKHLFKAKESLRLSLLPNTCS